MLLAAGMPADRLPAPPPSSFEAAGERVAAVAEGAVAKLEGWAAATQGWVAEKWSGLQLASAQAGESGPPSRAVASRRATPREVAPPLASDGREHARGRELRTFGAFAKAAGAAASAVAGSAADDVALPLRRVERRALTQEIGALSHDARAEQRDSAAACRRRRAGDGKSTPAPEIVALAESLGRSPGRIFRFVHDTIAYEPQCRAPTRRRWARCGRAAAAPGSRPGCSRTCCAPPASTRASSGATSRSRRAMLQDLTGVEDVFRAGDLLTTAGIASCCWCRAARSSAARLPHVWVKAQPRLRAQPRRHAGRRRHLDPHGPDARALRRGVRHARGRRRAVRARHLPAEWHRDLAAAGLRGGARAAYATTRTSAAPVSTLAPRRSVTRRRSRSCPARCGRGSSRSPARRRRSRRPMQQQLQLRGDRRREGASLLSAGRCRAPQVWGKQLELAWPGATAADQATIDLYGGIFATPPYGGRPEAVAACRRRRGRARQRDRQRRGRRATRAPSRLPPAPASRPSPCGTMFAGEHGVVLARLRRHPAAGGRPLRAARKPAAAARPTSKAGASRAPRPPTCARSTSDYRPPRRAALAAHADPRRRRASRCSAAPSRRPTTGRRSPSRKARCRSTSAPCRWRWSRPKVRSSRRCRRWSSSARRARCAKARRSPRRSAASTSRRSGFLTRAVRAGQTLTRVDEHQPRGRARRRRALRRSRSAPSASASARASIAWISRTQIEIGGWQTTGYILENPTNGAGAYLVTFERKVPLGETTVVFHSPVDLAEVTAPTEVVASHRSDNLHELDASPRKPAGEGATTVIASGTGPVDHAVLGTLRPHAPAQRHARPRAHRHDARAARS